MRPIMWERDTFSRDSAILTAIVAMLRRRNLLWQRNSTNLAAEIRLMCAKCVRNMWIVNFMAVHCLICSGWVHGPLGVLKLSDSAKTNWRRSTDIMDVFLYAWKWVSHTGWFNFFLPSPEIRMKTSYIKMAASVRCFGFCLDARARPQKERGRTCCLVTWIFLITCTDSAVLIARQLYMSLARPGLKRLEEVVGWGWTFFCSCFVVVDFFL